jgi:hypothetical protein
MATTVASSNTNGGVLVYCAAEVDKEPENVKEIWTTVRELDEDVKRLIQNFKKETPLLLAWSQHGVSGQASSGGTLWIHFKRENEEVTGWAVAVRHDELLRHINEHFYHTEGWFAHENVTWTGYRSIVAGLG